VIFVSYDQILEIHRTTINNEGGAEGCKSLSHVESILGTIEGGYLIDLQGIASGYWFYFVNGHPFIDGNKRVGLASAGIFLKLNGYTLDISEEDAERITLEIAKGSLGNFPTRESLIPLIKIKPSKP
jgi:death on curing protein